MEEISLTGATLLSDNRSKNSQRSILELSNTTSRTAVPPTDPVASSTVKDGLFENPKQHSDCKKSCCEAKSSNTLNNETATTTVKDGLLIESPKQHSDCKKSCCETKLSSNRLPVMKLNQPASEMVREQEPEQIFKTISAIVRMGPFELLEELLTAWKNYLATSDSNGGTATSFKQHLSSKDPSGHTVLHWAAKRTDDVRVLRMILQEADTQKLLHSTTDDKTGMTALHWACTESTALPIIRLLLEADNKISYCSDQNNIKLIEHKDSSGCTPLLIAAQYGQVESVAYLIQKGAVLHAVDNSSDTATHWAAYKGSAAVLGLLSFYDTQPLQKPDQYGQTPLHLAALRGNTESCRYILQHVSPNQARELLHLKDKNGRTPCDLAVHKQKPTTATVLQEHEDLLGTSAADHQYRWKRIMKQLQVVARQVRSLHSWKLWLGLRAGHDAENEAPQFPYYYVLSHFAANMLFNCAVFVPLSNISSGLLWDCMTWHTFNIFVLLAGMFVLRKCTNTDPGRLIVPKSNGGSGSHYTTACTSVDELKYWRRLYEETLEAYADFENRSEAVKNRQLCHTCHIARPPRSKHDRFSRTCVLAFDHYCPFVGTTVGLYNYKWFYMVLVSMTLYFVSFWSMLVLYTMRYRKENHGSTPVGILVIGVYLGLHLFMSGGMLIYHTQLVSFNNTPPT